MFWGTPSFFLGQKKYHDTFRKFQKTPTHPSGTFRVMFHQKSTCTPPPPPPGFGYNNLSTCSDLETGARTRFKILLEDKFVVSARTAFAK